ncbi:MAG: hypothetical protein R3E42_11640 [Burkholderiaceae bacterium]
MEIAHELIHPHFPTRPWSSATRSTTPPPVQAMDSAHFIHLTDHASLAAMGAEVIVRADNIYVFDSEGHKMLDAMSGCVVNAGYGRKELADAAYQQMMTLPFYNSSFNTTNVPAVKLATKLFSLLAPVVEGAASSMFLFQQRLGEQRDTQCAPGAPLLGPAGPAPAQGHHQPPQRLPRLHHGRRLAGRHGRHARAQGDLPIPDITHIEQPHCENALAR